MFQSKKAEIEHGALLSELSVVLGASWVGSRSIVDAMTVIGYPSASKVRRLREYGWRALDEASEGAKIGRGCIVRWGTVVYERAELGDGVQTGHNVLVREDTRVGSGTVIGTGTVLDGRVHIGQRVSIQTGVYIPPYTRIGDEVFIAPGVCFTNDRYPPSRRLLGVTVESRAVICARAVLISGVTIGEGAVVAAGSVVTRDVDPYTVVAGVPARRMMERDEYEEKKARYELEAQEIGS